MKKLKRTILLSIMSLLVNGAIGQSNLVTGSQTIALKYGGGRYSFGKYGQVDYAWTYREKFSLRGALSFEKATIGSTNIELGRLNVDNTFSVFNLGQRFYGNIVAGISGGFEASYTKRNPIRVSNFLFGGNLGVELDLFLTKKFSLKGEFLQHYMYRSNISPWFWTSSIGVSYVLN